ncbi:MAG: OmpA family protein [Bacteroidales bacterium]|nr:OmpA family protein [Bacteroidales bacterium]
MKKKTIAGCTLLAAATLLFASCVTLGKYEALEAANNQMKKEHNVTRQELADMREENAELLRQNQQMTADLKDLSDLKEVQAAELGKLRSELGNMKLGYDTVIENYMQKVAGKDRDLIKANDLLAARTKELNDREVAFAAKENAMLAEQAKTKAALEAKERELERVRKAVTNALVGFQDKGMNVETRDGKVYVSMESKLMFPSASWTVSSEGVDAIKGLAKVLEETPDLNIMVEGHTDNDAYKGSSSVKDNWDLSVMRATSIVKLLLKHGPKIDPARVEAAGHGEFAPKVANNNAANKAMNRRTEIILTPKVQDILNALGQE